MSDDPRNIDFLVRVEAAEDRDLARKKGIATPAVTLPLPKSAPIPPPSPASEPLELNTYFATLGPLAQGGFSHVWHARRRCDRKDVAIKVIKRPSSKDSVVVFQRELHALRVIARAGAYDHIVRLLANGVTPRRRTPALVLEMGRTSLRRHLSSSSARFPLTTVAEYMGQLVRAVRHLHVLSIVHRDLKPENVLLIAPEKMLKKDTAASQTLKVCDFGLARVLNAADQRLHTACGSPLYMAPELFRPPKAGYQGFPVDVWALGTLAYELLHRRCAFAGYPAVRDLERAVRTGRHGPIDGRVSAVFRRLITRCLVVAPGERATAAGLRLPVRRVGA